MLEDAPIVKSPEVIEAVYVPLVRSLALRLIVVVVVVSEAELSADESVVLSEAELSVDESVVLSEAELSVVESAELSELELEPESVIVRLIS